MKTYTNHAPGARGIQTKSGLVLLDPGQSAEIDPKEIVGAVPDLGSAPSADDDELVKAVEDENAALKTQVADLTKERDDLAAERDDLKTKLEAATKK